MFLKKYCFHAKQKIFSLNVFRIELFLWYGWLTKGVKPYFQPGPLSEILTIANLQHAASRVWTCAEPEFRLSWMKLCSSDNHYTKAPKKHQIHPRRTFLQPDTSPTDTSPIRHIPDGHFPDQTNARQIFAWLDASHNGHFPDRSNTSNNLKYL